MVQHFCSGAKLTIKNTILNIDKGTEMAHKLRKLTIKQAQAIFNAALTLVALPRLRNLLIQL